MLFEPYAAEVAQRVGKVRRTRVLETAAGTGILTRSLQVTVTPDVQIHATDLNNAMVERGSRAVAGPNVHWQVADAQALPFDDASFEVVVCQFGVMFFPDKELGYREARRVLRPGGHFIFVTWDTLAANEFSALAYVVLERLFPESTPQFLKRTPYGYHDVAEIEISLRRSGFADVRVETLDERSRSPRARDVAIGLFEGSPLRAQIEERDPAALPRAVETFEGALRERYGDGEVEGAMRAHIVTAT